MVRSAAKNWQAVAVLTDPSQYARVLEELERDGALGDASRFALAVEAFNRISNYDAAISDYLSSLDRNGRRSEFPDVLNLQFVKRQEMRYGENPHQSAAFYRDRNSVAGAIAAFSVLQGKELSYNNVADADAAWECVKSFRDPSCVIIKHANPCGVAIAASAAAAYAKAFKTDPTSAFGGIIAFNVPVDGKAAQAVAKQFVEVLIAPAYSRDALRVLGAKANVRVLECAVKGAGRNSHDAKRIGSGLLIQSADNHEISRKDLKFVSKRKPTAAQIKDLLFAWTVAKYVKSNAIVFCRGGMTVGVGAGQMSRIDSAKIAAIKAKSAGLSLKDSVVASDAFFPFRDGLDAVVKAGAVAVIQPGGSMRDDEVIAAADQRGVAMVFTGIRHFRH
jgi:phosphoribosylaminoimidazolecarboxamide formyltransferase/IMP cyclohydrolase